MIRIGEFSQLTSISINMLRNYDKIGLLIPKHVDNESGYRYYDKSQLVQANQIMAMKNMGLSLDDIMQTMSMSSMKIDKVIEENLHNRYQELEKVKNQIKQLESVLNINDNKKLYSLNIVTKKMDEMIVLSYQDYITNYNDEGILWESIHRLACENKIEIDKDAKAISINHGYDDNNGKMLVEIQLELNKKYKCSLPLKVKIYEPREVVSIVFKGQYSQISDINVVVAQWLDDNRYYLDGEVFSIYYRSPGNCNDENKFITEMCFPVKKI